MVNIRSYIMLEEFIRCIDFIDIRVYIKFSYEQFLNNYANNIEKIIDSSIIKL